MTDLVVTEHRATPRRSLRVALSVFVVTRALFLLIAYAAVVMASGKATVPNGASRPQMFYDTLTGWDGQWYVAAATRGYGEAGVNPGTPESTRPFFPLLPALIKAGTMAGIDPNIAGLAASNLAFLAALYFSHRLFDLWRGGRFATRATWIAGIAPFSGMFSMIYADGLLLLGAVAAWYSYERRHRWAAGAWASVAVLSRPNGYAVVAVLAFMVIGFVLKSDDRIREAIRWIPVVVLPSFAFSVWMVLMARWAGSPLAFLSAKKGWTEVTIFSALSPNGAAPPTSMGTVLHLALTIAAFGVLFLARRFVPLSWIALWVLYVVPALFLGLAGSGRYAWTLFPVFGASAVVLERPAFSKPLAFGLGVCATLVTIGIFQGRLVP
jgi:hypothetical protein